MKRSVSLWQPIGFAVTSLVGTILHFLYDWTGEALWAAPFSSVNESTWEHMKILFWPMLLFAVVQSFFKSSEGYWCVKLRSILLGVTLIPVIFYLYNGAVGRSPDWFNIAIFFIAAVVAYIYEARQLKKDSAACKSPRLAIALLCALALLFVIFTFIPPEIEIFKDPITNGYSLG